MLTSEVVIILKKALLLTLALVFAFGSHLRPCLDFTVAGQELKSGCTPEAARKAKAAALAAAEEILPGPAHIPEAKAHIRLSLRPGRDTAPQLSHAMLCACEGVMSADRVYLGGKYLGSVANGTQLRGELRHYIGSTLPSWASSGSVPGYLELKPGYTRQAWEVSTGDMILLITGMSPVMYTDGKGRISPV